MKYTPQVGDQVFRPVPDTTEIDEFSVTGKLSLFDRLPPHPHSITSGKKDNCLILGMNSGKVGVIRSPKFRKTGLAARLLSGCFSPSALNTRQDGQFLRWGHQVLCSSTQVQDAYDPDSRPQAENRFMGVHCWGNTETEGCGGGQEAQNPPVFMSILTLD